MTNEELQKMLEFVAQRQEVFAANMDKAEKRMNQLERGFVSLFNLVNETAQIQRALAESQKELQAQQAHTDERLSALINVVEKFISEGRNGRNSS
jgi:small-conductance mechanosensitive channel